MALIKFLIISFLILITGWNAKLSPNNKTNFPKTHSISIPADTVAIISKATSYLAESPVPITTFSCPRSSGGLHDFFSEGDYWWPDPDHPEGPYIRKDGQTNPQNFNAHRKAMRDLNKWVSTLVAAYQVSGDKKYSEHAINHLRAFFLNENTLMNPNLVYAQAIKGIASGRGIGIIDTIHLIEIVLSIQKLKALGALNETDYNGLKQWFNDYATWMNSHKYGLEEKDHGNNHSTWWAAQLASFSSFAGREDLREVAVSQFKKLLSTQMSEDGSFPEEMSRTKGYSYSLFNLEGFSVLCHLLSTKDEDLWDYDGKNGSLKKAWNYMLPFIENKYIWPNGPDIAHFDELPIQSVGFLMAAEAYDDVQYKSIWRQLSPEKKSEEIERTFPLWQATLWFN
jgi:hypothetical protein